MANLQKTVRIAAGSQFDGTAGKGLIAFGDSAGTDVVSISFVLGGEAKDITITKIDKFGADRGMVYQKLATTAQHIELSSGVVVALGPEESLKIVSVNAASQMFAFITHRELKG